jgi:hypothetical protein
MDFSNLLSSNIFKFPKIALLNNGTSSFLDDDFLFGVFDILFDSFDLSLGVSGDLSLFL